MEIRPIDLFDDATMRRFHEIVWRAETEDGRPWNPCWSYAEMSLRLREPTGESEDVNLGLYDRERMVAAGMLELPVVDNRDKAFVEPFVEPELRGRGLGGRLLEALCARAAEAGRSLVLGMSAVPVEQRDTHPTIGFAETHGFRLANTEISRLLPLPLPDGLLDEVVAETVPFHEGYQVETYVDEVPERHLAAYCHLRNQLVLDAPTGDVDFEAEQATPEMVAARVERARRMDRRTYYTFAVCDGEAVAHSDLYARVGSPVALQMGTLVRRDHRGHRLGTAVKLANLAALRQDRPDVTGVHTQNAETNEWMVGINVRLGFETVGVNPEFVRDLSGSRAAGDSAG